MNMSLQNRKLLYASPFPPKKNGISDYSEMMVNGLKKYFDITILIDDYKPSCQGLCDDFDIKVYGKDRVDFEGFDHILYNVGNCPDFHLYIYDSMLKHPGHMILHDLSIYYLTLGYYKDRTDYYSSLYRVAEPEDFFELKMQLRKGMELFHAGPDIPSRIRLNKEMVLSSKGVIVHSKYSKNSLSDSYKGLDLLQIEMPYVKEQQVPVPSDYLRNMYGISNKATVLASFGYIHDTKLNHLVCRAVKKLNKELAHRIYYIMVGAGDYIDDYLDGNIIKTGYVEKSVYNDILERSNIVFSLRYPSMGETSASLIKALGRGKPCFVTDDAWFSELPDNAVIKMSKNSDESDIYTKLMHYLNDPEALKAIATKAFEYMDSRPTLDQECKRIRDFLS